MNIYLGLGLAFLGVVAICAGLMFLMVHALNKAWREGSI